MCIPYATYINQYEKHVQNYTIYTYIGRNSFSERQEHQQDQLFGSNNLYANSNKRKWKEKNDKIERLRGRLNLTFHFILCTAFLLVGVGLKLAISKLSSTGIYVTLTLILTLSLTRSVLSINHIYTYI